MTTEKMIYTFSFDEAFVAIRIVGTSQTKLAKQLNVKPQSVHNAMKQPNRYRRISAAIQEIIDDVDELMDLSVLRSAS